MAARWSSPMSAAARCSRAIRSSSSPPALATGTFANIIYPAGYNWTNSLSADGRVGVESVGGATSGPEFLPGGVAVLPDGNISLTAAGAVGDVLPPLGEPRCGGHADYGYLDLAEQRDDQHQSVHDQRPDGDELPETVLLVQHAVSRWVSGRATVGWLAAPPAGALPVCGKINRLDDAWSPGNHSGSTRAVRCFCEISPLAGSGWRSGPAFRDLGVSRGHCQ